MSLLASLDLLGYRRSTLQTDIPRSQVGGECSSRGWREPYQKRPKGPRLNRTPRPSNRWREPSENGGGVFETKRLNWFAIRLESQVSRSGRRGQIWARRIRILNSKNVAIASPKSDDVRIVQAINFASNAILERCFFGDALESAALPAKMKTNRMPRRFLNAKET